MSDFLYLTADEIGTQTGGGAVTFHESEALKTLGDTRVIGRKELTSDTVIFKADAAGEPWIWDSVAYHKFGSTIRLAHVYAGTFTESVKKLRQNGTKVAYTCAAHSIEASRKEHEKWGHPFPYTHLTDPALWQRYVAGYLAADVVVCPSRHSADCMKSYGAKWVEIIPHGVDLPESTDLHPDKFTVGYLGAVGPDKGLIYLLQAWKKLDYKDAILLIAGKDSQSDYVKHLLDVFGGGEIGLVGWVGNVADFYNSLSLYVQPSVTEGYGIEVPEAMSYRRPVLCSTGAGAVDCIPDGWSFPPCDVDTLARKIDIAKRIAQNKAKDDVWYDLWRQRVKTWEEVRGMYVELWKKLLKE